MIKFITKPQNILLAVCVLAISLVGCNTTKQIPSTNKAVQLIQKMEQANGGWAALLKLKDVEYTYKYDDKAKGIDMSTERYIFQDESSWADYSQHNVNVMPGMGGKVIQSYVDGVAKITKDGAMVSDEAAIGGTAFLRHANFYWFTMMYKLNDPNAVQQYMNTEKVNGITYDRVKVTYKGTGKTADDEYILYFNPSTSMVDQFYFSLPAFGINEPVIRMELEYQKIDGVYVATHRKGFFPDGKGGHVLGGEYTSSNIKFNNGFKKADFQL